MNLQRLAAKQVEFTPASLFNKGEAGVWYDPSAASGSLDWRKNLLEYTESFAESYWTTKQNVIVRGNQIVSPDGTNTADKVEEGSTNNTFHFVGAALTTSAGVKTFSTYFKAGERDFAALTLRVNDGNDRLAVLFNLTNGTVSDTITLGSPTQTSSSIQDVGNGWYRCRVSAYHSAGSVIVLLNPHDDGTSSAINMDYAGIVGHGVYAWGAQVEEASTASSYQPILSTFENAFKTAFPSHTLYQDSQGETPVTAVGEPVGLMLDKSEGLAQGPELVTNGDFATDSGWSNQAGWTIGGGVASVNSSVAGSTYIRQGSTVIGRMYQITFEVTSFTSGALYATAGSAASGGPITSTGVYTRLALANTTQGFGVYAAGSTAIASIDNISVVEVAGSHATQPTSTKRPIYARHPEGGIRNLLNYTEQFDNGYWSKSNATITSNSILAPDGSTTAETLTCPSTGANSFVARGNIGVVGKGYTATVYAKAGTNDIIRIANVSSASNGCWYNLTSGAVGTSNGAANTAAIEDVGNGWYRLTRYFDSFLAGGNQVVIASCVADGSINGPSAGETIHIWGAQLEEATKASNYQKVVTDIDVTESGVGEVYYLKFDGFDDGMLINNVTSANTPLTALFGYSATNADAGNAYKRLLDIETGRTLVVASTTAGSIGYFDGAWRSFAADTNAIKVLTYDLVEDNAKIRVDGTQEYSDTTYDQKAIGGTIGLFQEYFQTQQHLGGNMYQTILRAAESTDEEITKAETYVANKTGLKAQVDGIATLDLNFGANLYTAKNSNGGVIRVHLTN